MDNKGTVKICGWLGKGVIGSLLCQSMKEIYHSKKARELRKRFMNQDYSLCNVDECPFLATNDMDNHLVEVEEIPEYPEELHMAYENVCNYHCISCTVHDIMARNQLEGLESGYEKIEDELKKVLPYIKKLEQMDLENYL